jgi:hypothetical protein
VGAHSAVPPAYVRFGSKAAGPVGVESRRGIIEGFDRSPAGWTGRLERLYNIPGAQ